MPKILTNVRESLIAETRKQVNSNGYAATSIRSVASACNIAAGTVYNYFKSKDELIACFMAEDWMNTLQDMKARCEATAEPIEVVDIMGKSLTDFINEHRALFEDPQASVGYAMAMAERHAFMINQLTEVLKIGLSNSLIAAEADICTFIAETILTWTLQRREFSDYHKIISHLLK